MNVRQLTKIFGKYVFACVFSITTAIIFFILSQFLNELIIFYLGISMAFIVFFFSSVVLYKGTSQWSIKLSNAQITLLLIYILTIMSIFLVLFVPAFEGSMLELDEYLAPKLAQVFLFFTLN